MHAENVLVKKSFQSCTILTWYRIPTLLSTNQRVSTIGSRMLRQADVAYLHVVILCNVRRFAQGVGDIVVLLDPDCAMIAPMNMCVSHI